MKQIPESVKRSNRRRRERAEAGYAESKHTLAANEEAAFNAKLNALLEEEWAAERKATENRLAEALIAFEEAHERMIAYLKKNGLRNPFTGEYPE